MLNGFQIGKRQVVGFSPGVRMSLRRHEYEPADEWMAGLGCPFLSVGRLVPSSKPWMEPPDPATICGGVLSGTVEQGSLAIVCASDQATPPRSELRDKGQAPPWGVGLTPTQAIPNPG